MFCLCVPPPDSAAQTPRPGGRSAGNAHASQRLLPNAPASFPFYQCISLPEPVDRVHGRSSPRDLHPEKHCSDSHYRSGISSCDVKVHSHDPEHSHRTVWRHRHPMRKYIRRIKGPWEPKGSQSSFHCPCQSVGSASWTRVGALGRGGMGGSCTLGWPAVMAAGPAQSCFLPRGTAVQ